MASNKSYKAAKLVQKLVLKIPRSIPVHNMMLNAHYSTVCCAFYHC